MFTVDYKFTMDQKVTTPFDETGIISMLGFDEAGNQYYVKTKADSKWFKEKELDAADAAI